MRLEVFNLNLLRLGMINKFSIVQYNTPFCGVGSFTINIPVTESNINLIKKDRIIWIEEDVAGIVQYIEKSVDNSSDMKIKGKLISCILDWRYVYPTFTKTGNPISIMYGLVNAHCINPTDERRKFSKLTTVGNSKTIESISYQKTGGSVAEALDDLGAANDLGYTIQFNPRNEKSFSFKVLTGKDRTIYNKSGNVPVMFSQSLNNIIKGEYVYNDCDYRSVALVAGEAYNNNEEDTQGATRRTLEVGDNVSYDLRRRELYVDARDIQSEYSEEVEGTDEEGNTITNIVEKTMSDEEYMANLSQRGNEKLSEHVIEESYSGEIRTDAKTTYKYKKDYFLGDKVTVIDEDIGVKIDATVTDMLVTYDASGYSYEPTFGYSLPTLETKIKRSM